MKEQRFKFLIRLKATERVVAGFESADEAHQYLEKRNKNTDDYYLKDYELIEAY